MAIPDFQTSMLPVRQEYADGRLANRVAWAQRYLKQSALLDSARRGHKFRAKAKGGVTRPDFKDVGLRDERGSKGLWVAPRPQRRHAARRTFAALHSLLPGGEH
jgi:restriction endonuclease Mrr